MKKNKYIWSFIIILSLVFFTTNFVSATSIVPQGDKYETGSYELNDFLLIAVNVSKIILGLVGSLTLLMFVYGGLMMIISSGNTEKVTKAKGILLAAVVGLAIVFASYVIIQFVMTSLGVKNWSGGTNLITAATSTTKISMIK
jgi:hypothetical protein